MGQKTNPIIFRINNNNTNTWQSSYFEKKSTESALYHFKNFEIRKFIYRFFDDNGLIIHKLKLSYLNNALHIFISYFSTLKTTSTINKNNKIQKIKPTTKFQKDGNLKKYEKLKRSTKKLIKYKELDYITKSQKYSKRNIEKKTQLLKLRRIRFLKYYKNCLTAQKYENFSNTKTNSFLNKFFESLVKFTNRKVNISLTLNKLNPNVKQTITKKKLQILKKNLTKLRKYEQNDFFKEGVNILFLATTQKNSAKLLSQFISNELQKLKRHNFFLRFIKTVLVLFNTKTFSNLKGIKIKIKGRFNRAPRARHKIIEISNGVPVLTINSKLDYAETTAFTSNGTFGVKVWICEENKILCLLDQNKQNTKKLKKENYQNLSLKQMT